MHRTACVVALCVCAHLSLAQTLTGRVTDADSGEPLIGVTVGLLATETGTSTGVDGRYTLAVGEGGGTLVFTYVGYARVERAFTSGTASIDVSLGAGGIGLDEVVVTALGLERDNAELGYAVQQLDDRVVSDVPATNFLDNLSGQLAGVDVVSGPTGVGSTSLVSIRGEASFTGNTPLYVVDGVPVDNRSVLNTTDERSQGFQEIDFGGGSPEVSPFDVESVSVLKGPAAAALYGTRAANGVIIVNTKGGGKPTGLGVDLNSITSFERPFKLPEFQNTYGQGNAGAFAYENGSGGGTNDGISFSYGPRLDEGLAVAQFDGPVTLPDGSVVRGGDLALRGGAPIAPTPFVAHPDNLRDLYETGATTQNNVSLRQGFSGGDYRLSFTDVRSDSYIPGVDLRRNNLAARLSFAPVERFRVSAGLTYVNTRSDNRPASGYGSENVNYSTVAWLGRSTDLNSLRDYWQPGLEGLEQFSFNTNFFDNPFFILSENRNSFRRDRLFGYVQGSIDLTDKLELRLRTGLDYSNEARELRRAFSSNRFRQGAYAENDLSFTERNSDLLLTYADGLGDFDYSLSVGGNRLEQRAESQQTQAVALAQAGVYRLGNAAVPLENFGQLTERRINSLYALARVGWREQLFLDLTGRNDWSSSLATPSSTDGTGFFYPSAGLSWLASRSVDLPTAISYLQLRGSAAQVGNDTDPYRTTGTFVTSTPVGGAPTFTDGSTLPAEGLRPERATAYELGADVRFLDDRFGLDLTVYTQLNEDQILALPTPISSGYTTRIVNGGSVRARGIEAIAAVRDLRLGVIRYDARVNFSSSRATVLELPDGVERTTLAYSRVYDNPNQTVYFIAEEGGQIGDLWGTGYLRNEEGEYIVSASGEFIADNELKRLGNYNPDFTVGFSNTLRYGGFSFDFLLDWRQGGELVSRTLSLGGYSGQLVETENRPEEGIVVDAVVNTGSAENPSYVTNTTPITPENYYVNYYNRNHEENNTYDASYLKLRELRLGYSCNVSSLRYLNRLDLAVIGRNLYAFSGIPHFDPEQFAVQGQRFVRGVEDMSYPTPRSIGVSVSVGF